MALSALAQGGIIAGVLAGCLVLSPCSPLSIWGSRFCPLGPSASAAPAAPAAVDLPAELREASRQKPVVLAFHASWCGPCRKLEPELAAAVAGKPVQLMRVDVDAQPELAARLGVDIIPDVRLLVDGVQLDAFRGYRDRAALERFLAGAVRAD